MRDYVIIAQKYQEGDIVMFWGRRSRDEDNRSYTGYTKDFDICEKYTIEEIGASPYQHKVYGVDEFNPALESHFVVSIKDLSKLGLSKKIVYSY